MFYLKIYGLLALIFGSLFTVCLFKRWLRDERSEEMISMIEQAPMLGVPVFVISMGMLWPYVVYQLTAELFRIIIGIRFVIERAPPQPVETKEEGT